VKHAVVAAALVLALGAGGGDASVAPKPRPAGVDWGAGHFTASDALKNWLANRGVRYDDWLERHPRGAYLMTHPAPAARTPGAQARVRTSRVSGAAILAIYALAAALLVLAAVPGRLLVGVIPIEHHARLAPARTIFVAVGLSLLVGATVASLL
jgi:hypothetical protein